MDEGAAAGVPPALVILSSRAPAIAFAPRIAARHRRAATAGPALILARDNCGGIVVGDVNRSPIGSGTSEG